MRSDSCEPPGTQWRKSSYSGDQGGDCIEVARLPHGRAAAVRDSKNPDGPAILLGRAAFAAFLRTVTG
ncbi:DUF397 domain-containing protein [Streptomyces sp. NPDC059070]|uniref:DUF397 domain-containing protein n=1 Tax=unclassified Streptomyces TaxID=2593676 RepID=UPI0034E1970C